MSTYYQVTRPDISYGGEALGSHWVGSSSETCIRIQFDTVMKNMSLATTGGPTSLSWTVQSDEVCSSTVCTLDLCGFEVGSYTIGGIVYFQQSTGIPVST
eukprot:gene20702-24810_t